MSNVRPHMITVAHVRSAGIVALVVMVCAVVLLLAVTFHRPLWGLLGVLLSCVAMVRTWRARTLHVALVLVVLALCPLAIAVLVDITQSTWASQVAGVVVAIALLAAAGLFFFARQPRGFVACVLVWQLMLLLPFDLGFTSVPNGPRLVPLVMGLLSEQGIAAAKRGEFVSGGCIVSGLEPRWVLAW
jgi:hypothetical protein